MKRLRKKINDEKTEFCIFSRDQSVLDQELEVKMTNTKLKRTRSPKLLRVILDEKVTFHEHVQMVELKAQKSDISIEYTWKD